MQNLEHIRMLVLSADLGSFSACARKLGKVQSAVSHGINSLEILILDLLNKQVDHKSKTQVEFNRKSLVKKPFYLMVAVNNKIVERWISPTNKKDAVLIEILERIQKKQATNE